LNQPDRADDEAEVAAGHDAAAGARAVGVDGGFDVCQRQVESDELLRIEIELKLGGDAAEVRDVGDARHLLERGNDDPALEFGQLALPLGVGLQRIVEDLAGRRCHGIETRCQSRRQGGVLDALVDALTRPIILDAVAEHDGDQRQTERAFRAHEQEARRAVELALERDRDPLFDLFGRHAGRLGDDLRARVRDVRIGIDRELGPGIVPVNGEKEADHRHHHALSQRQGDEGVNH
jgi:hypothetical protein